MTNARYDKSLDIFHKINNMTMINKSIHTFYECDKMEDDERVEYLATLKTVTEKEIENLNMYLRDITTELNKAMEI